jgi:threonine/homoserine/homoserine lactone efflux protein
MMGVHDFWLFLAAGLLLNVTPGPDMALIIARSAQHGTRAGIAAALGVGAGAFVHILAAAIGIAALIVASAYAFTVLKWIGGIYLVYVGLELLRRSFQVVVATDAGMQATPPISMCQIFLQGALTNILNPKVAIFFLAFLPQFVDPEAPCKVAAFVILGLIFNATGTFWNVGVAWFAGTLARSERLRPTRIWLERAIGAVFVGLGLKLALAERP